MDMTRRFACVTAAGVLLCLARPALADAAGVYRELFDQEEKAVAASKDPNAPAELAALLLRSSANVTDDKPLRQLLLLKAYEFGIKTRAGYAAAEAMETLLAEAPDCRAEAQDKLMVVGQLLFDHANPDKRKLLGQELANMLVAFGDDRAQSNKPDEATGLYRRALAVATKAQCLSTMKIVEKILADMLVRIAADNESARRRKDLQAAMRRDPKDPAARKALVLALLGQFDKPAEAAGLLTGDLDESFRTHVQLAASDADALDEPTCLDLARWYVDVARAAPPADKDAILIRAQACCKRYMMLHATRDAGMLKGKLLLDDARRYMEPVAGMPRYIDVPLGKGVMMTLALIPAGSFVMGVSEREMGFDQSESTRYAVVNISKPFYIGVCEITREQYKVVTGGNPDNSADWDKPVNQVNWFDAAAFCGKLSERTGRAFGLPTRAQWEYACRAGTRTTYYFGNDTDKLGDYAWFVANSEDQTHRVALKKPNSAGLHDMYGNVLEWCADWWADSCEIASPVDPAGPATGKLRLICGGGFGNAPNYCRSGFMGGVNPYVKNTDLGFRVVMAAN